MSFKVRWHRSIGYGLGAAAIVALLVVLGWWWLFGVYDSNSHHLRDFNVYAGEPTRSIAERLARSHLVHTDLGFIILAEQKHWANRLRPGTYRLSGSESPLSMLTKMVRGQSIDQISVSDGIRSAQVFSRLQSDDIGTRQAYQWLARHPLAGMPAKVPGVRDAIEGYLYPATYSIPRGSTARDAISLMWQAFQAKNRALEKDLPRGWTVRRWVTLASIVQAEVRYSQDDAKVAAVFLNRERLDMPLQSDATVYYALGNQAQGGLTQADLDVASPYNTYRVRGLPPGPIDNPGPQALYAVLHPARVGYLYFITGPNGHAVFASTYAQQLQHIRQLHRNNRGK